MGNSEVGHLNIGAGRIVYQVYFFSFSFSFSLIKKIRNFFFKKNF